MNNGLEAKMIATMIKDANWQSETVYIDGPGIGRPARITLGELRIAAKESDLDLRVIYADLARRAEDALEADRLYSMMRHDRHVATRTTEYGFSAPIMSAEPNPAAHGNIVQTEYCACGARRSRNVNGNHVEQGIWE